MTEEQKQIKELNDKLATMEAEKKKMKEYNKMLLSLKKKVLMKA